MDQPHSAPQPGRGLPPPSVQPIDPPTPPARSDLSLQALIVAAIAASVAFVPYAYVLAVPIVVAAAIAVLIARRRSPTDPRLGLRVRWVLALVPLTVGFSVAGFFVTRSLETSLDRLARIDELEVRITRCELDGAVVHVAGTVANAPVEGFAALTVSVRVIGASGRITAGETTLNTPGAETVPFAIDVPTLSPSVTCAARVSDVIGD